ncbi:MAG: alpha-L-rhamnosidase N-terminal domain-containing protein, partial [Bacteroidales bacterium]|nr:alpha-L-rhamnosidase N-terminal domain-containing protein [Bacteroidales bacterium]
MNTRNILSALLLLAAFQVRAALTAYDLRCELLHQPCGINTTTPALSWKLTQDHNGVRQSAYQILAATRPELLSEDKADLWNSGRVESGQSIWIKYAGKPLASRSEVYWQVKVWDEKQSSTAEGKVNGKGGDWARGAWFSVGILDKSLWRGKYIGMPRENRKVQPLLHKTFDCTDAKAPAFLHISTLGYHEIYLNGERIGDDVLAPSVVEFSKRHQAMSYKLDGRLREGRNDLVIWLGGGFYDNPKIVGVREGGPYVLAQIDQQRDGGWQTLVATDGSWQSRGSGYYDEGIAGAWTFGGEVVNAAELLPDFTAPTLDAVSWQGVSTMDLPEQEITPMMCEPNRIMMEVGAQKVWRFDGNKWMVDMGRSIVGWTRIRLGKLRKG